MKKKKLYLAQTLDETGNIFTGALLLPLEEIEEVYQGVWGYNSLLTMAALSCVFYSFNAHSVLMSATATLACVVAQFALRANMFVQVSMMTSLVDPPSSLRS